MDAIDVLDEMIVDTARRASAMAVAFPKDFDRLNAGTGVGIRLQALVDARNAIRTARARELETERKPGILEP